MGDTAIFEPKLGLQIAIPIITLFGTGGWLARGTAADCFGYPIAASVVETAWSCCSGRGAWALTGRDMSWEIAAAVFVAASFQGVIRHRWIEQPDGQA
jgi:hypothetical protein